MQKNKKPVLERPIRQITLPEEVIALASMTHVSIPSKLGAHLNKLMLSFLFLLLLCLPMAFYIDAINSSSSSSLINWFVAFFLLLILAGIGYAVLNYFYKSTNKAPPTVYVTPTELYIEDEQGANKKHIFITWAKVISNPKRYADVYFTSASESVLQYWNFFEKDDARKVANTLGINDLRAMGIKNKWAINRAILANFAVQAKEPLAIDASLFVKLKINPITWQHDNRAKFVESLFAAIAMLAVCVALSLFFTYDNLSENIAYLLGGITLILLLVGGPIAFIGYAISSKLYPEFYGDSIVFLPPKVPKLKTAFEQAIDDFYSAK